MAGVLTVFAKKIRKIEFQRGDVCKVQSWSANDILETGTGIIEQGKLFQRDIADDLEALHFRFNKGGGMLVGIGPQGLRALPDKLPAIWVVAPTHEYSGLGFAITAFLMSMPGESDCLETANQMGLKGFGSGKIWGKAYCQYLIMPTKNGLNSERDFDCQMN